MISIITPSYNQLQFLVRCCASVADQSESCEHIIVDAGSTDGTVEWLKQQAGVRWISEKDGGMYDAINKGIRMAKGDLIAYLNCDEQYLPGTLGYVRRFMSERSDAGMVFGDALLVQPDGGLVAFRKAYPLRWSYVATSHLYVLTCTLFLRREVFDTVGVFDSRWKTCGDADLVLRVLFAGIRAVHLRRYLAVFLVTGNNLGSSEIAAREIACFKTDIPAFVKLLSPLFNAMRLVEKVLGGAYWQRWPLYYELYMTATTRTMMTASRGSFRWPRQAKCADSGQ